MPTKLRNFTSEEARSGEPEALVRERAAGAELFRVRGTEIRRVANGPGWRIVPLAKGSEQVIEFSRGECDALERAHSVGRVA